MKKMIVLVVSVLIVCIYLFPMRASAGSAVTTETCLACKTEIWMEELFSFLRAGDTDNATTYLKSGKCIQLEKGVKVSVSAYPTKEIEIMAIDLLGDKLWSLNSFLSDFHFSEDEQMKMAAEKIKNITNQDASVPTRISCADEKTKDLVIQYAKRELYLVFKNQIEQEKQQLFLKEIEGYNFDVLNIKSIENNSRFEKLECAGDLVSTENGETTAAYPIAYFYEISKDNVQNVTVFGLPFRSLAESYAKIDKDCSLMEYDGLNALAALASYFADPSRTTAPTADELIREEELSTNFPFKIAQAGDDFIVFVIDEKNKCSKGSAYIVSINGINEWIR